MNLKNALFISFVGHCCVLAPLGNIWFFTPNKKSADVQIVYYKINPPIENRITKPAPALTKEVPAVQPPKEEPLTIEKNQARQTRLAKKTRPLKARMPRPKPEETAQAKSSVIPSSIPGTTLPNTPECVSYYKYVREEIRRFLKKHYTQEYEEGDVMVSFALNQGGEVVSLSIINNRSSDNADLRNLSYRGIQDVSPFRPFPKNLSQKQISFNLTVVFKKN